MSPKITSSVEDENFTRAFLNNFNRISEFLIESEEEILEIISNDLSEVDHIDLNNSDLVSSVFIPRLKTANVTSRSYCLSALIFALRNNKSEIRELEQIEDRNAANIREMLNRISNAEETEDFPLVDSTFLAYHCFPKEYDSNKSEIVFNRVPKDYLPEIPNELKRFVSPLFSNKKTGDDKDYFGTVSHELTHFYINSTISDSGYNLKTLQDQKPYLVSVDEAAAFSIASLHSEQTPDGSYYRSEFNAPVSVIENCSKSFLKMTEEMDLKQRKRKIRETASEMIKKAASGENTSAVKDFIDGNLDKKIKRFNRDREKTNQYITHALVILGIFSSSKFPDSKEVSFNQHIRNIEDLISSLEKIADKSPELQALHRDLKSMIENLKSDEKRLREDYEMLEEDQKEAKNMYQLAYVGDINYESHIVEKSQKYLEIIEDLEKGLNDISSMLQRFHSDEEQEAQMLSQKKQVESIKSLITETEKAYNEVNQALNDLENARKLMENYT
ncbi:hypothetical protein GKQ38_05465 [Candidatus Nanohaloarchaea archaeon]|nr:hypothetical protein GKQ38_05465 [Candidatus Nanohaloarchaea archaeon]